MLLYLIRHAEAVELGSPGAARDFDRGLTPRGRDQSRALAEAFVRMRLPVDAVAASPLVRAHQTAVELLSVWHPGARVVTCDHLSPERLKPGKLADFLAEYRKRYPDAAAAEPPRRPRLQEPQAQPPQKPQAQEASATPPNG